MAAAGPIPRVEDGEAADEAAAMFAAAAAAVPVDPAAILNARPDVPKRKTVSLASLCERPLKGKATDPCLVCLHLSEGKHSHHVDKLFEKVALKFGKFRDEVWIKDVKDYVASELRITDRNGNPVEFSWSDASIANHYKNDTRLTKASMAAALAKNFKHIADIIANTHLLEENDNGEPTVVMPALKAYVTVTSTQMRYAEMAEISDSGSRRTKRA